MLIAHLPLVVVGDVYNGYQESQDDQVKEEVGVFIILRVVDIGVLHVHVHLPCRTIAKTTSLLIFVGVGNLSYINIIIPLVLSQAQVCVRVIPIILRR